MGLDGDYSASWQETELAWGPHHLPVPPPLALPRYSQGLARHPPSSCGAALVPSLPPTLRCSAASSSPSTFFWEREIRNQGGPIAHLRDPQS